MPPRINYLLAASSHRIGKAGGGFPAKEGLRTHLRELAKTNTKDLAQVTILRALPLIRNGDYEADTAYYWDIDTRSIKCPVVVLDVPDYCFSYSSWVQALTRWRTEFDYYILIEDDYYPAHPAFAEILAAEHRRKLPDGGLLAGFATDHAACVNGIVDSATFVRCLDRLGRAGTLAACRGQDTFGQVFCDDRLSDYTDRYRTLFASTGVVELTHDPERAFTVDLIRPLEYLVTGEKLFRKVVNTCVGYFRPKEVSVKRVLLTGADGFIGSHCVEHFLARTDWQIVCLSSWSHGGFTERLTDSHVADHRRRVEVYTHDLTADLSPLLLSKLAPIDAVVHFAAESHVDTSIAEPRMVILNNVACTLTVLELARRLTPKIVIQISTDEVFGPADDVGHAEWSPLLPSNPYACSKGSQELAAISFWRTYGVPVVIVNAMNNIGERQHPEKFLPTVVRSVMRGETVRIHASGDTVGSRNYLHARTFADACRWLIERGEVTHFQTGDRPPPYGARPDRWNVPGQKRLTNLEFAQRIATLVGKPLHYELIDGNQDRPGHDLHYGLDGTKITQAGWVAPMDFDASLEKTVAWYLNNPSWLELS